MNRETVYLARPLDYSGRLNLLCFPYAGGNSAFCASWTQSLPNWITLCPVILPGRDELHQHPPATDFATLIHHYARCLLPQLQHVRYAIYGHSMGAWLAHALALHGTQQQRAPEALLISGQRGPQLTYPFPRNQTMTDQQLIDFILKFSSIEPRVLQNKNWLQWMLVRLRADLCLCETHSPVAESELLSCPVHLFANGSDPLINIEQQMCWKVTTIGRFSYSMFQGDHFFIRSQETEFLKTMLSVLTHTYFSV